LAPPPPLASLNIAWNRSTDSHRPHSPRSHPLLFFHTLSSSSPQADFANLVNRREGSGLNEGGNRGMSKGIPVAYDALPSTSDFETVRADVERQLPLRNLHWVRKSSAARTIRTIQALPLDIRPLAAFGEAPSKPNLLERPYLYLLFVVCDVRPHSPSLFSSLLDEANRALTP
jgi:hypothetical protein